MLLIPGTSSVDHLEQNLAVTNIELDEATRRQLNEVAWHGGVTSSADFVVDDLVGEQGISTRDLFYPDVLRLQQRSSAKGAPVRVTVCPGAFHVYPLAPAPEGRAAAARIIGSAVGLDQ